MAEISLGQTYKKTNKQENKRSENRGLASFGAQRWCRASPGYGIGKERCTAKSTKGENKTACLKITQGFYHELRETKAKRIQDSKPRRR